MGRYSGKTCRLLSMLSLTFSFFLVEIIYGYVTHSLALVSDAYHMLSDVVALVVGIASVRISKLNSRKNTYGWARAEVLGALVNSVFLIALCFTIFVEAIQRLIETEPIEHPEWMLYVGIAGLVVNVIGLMLFHKHSHGHGGHSHGDTKCDKEKALIVNEKKTTTQTVTGSHSDDVGHNSSNDCHHDDDDDDSKDTGRLKSSSQLNMRGVFLHVLGDALGSVIVIISSLIIKYVEHDIKFKIDPIMSMVMVIIMLSTTIPLLKDSALILLQTVPTHIQVMELKDKLTSTVEGVLAVHEFHVWQLAGNRIIASAHIRCQNLRDYMRVAEDVKKFFHREGIHSTTIQPEFVEFEEVSGGRDCILECGPDKTCHADTCCVTKKFDSTPERDSDTVVRQRNTAVPPSNTALVCDNADRLQTRA